MSTESAQFQWGAGLEPVGLDTLLSTDQSAVFSVIKDVSVKSGLLWKEDTDKSY
jgi:hypothetical protein